MKLKNILTAVVGAGLLTVGSVNAWASSGSVSVDGMTFVYVKLFNSSSYRNNKDSSSK